MSQKKSKTKIIIADSSNPAPSVTIRTLVPEPIVTTTVSPLQPPVTPSKATFIEDVMKDDEDIDVDNDIEDKCNPEFNPDDNDTDAPKKRKPRTKKVYVSSDELFEQLIGAMTDLRSISRRIINLTRETQKSVHPRREKAISNGTEIGDGKGAESRKPPHKPRGFALPAPISNELVDYLRNEAHITSIERRLSDEAKVPVEIKYGCLLARNELTSALCDHFRNSPMRKNDHDKRDIYLDPPTTQLFGIDVQQFKETGGRLSTNGEPIIMYFDLQKYLPKHCGKLAQGH
jgi:hypothetical protein